MKVTPVKQYSEPTFPTRNIIDEHPEILRLVPKRWRGNPVVIAALAATAAMMLTVRSYAKEPEAAPFVGKTLVRAGILGDIAVKILIPTEEEARQVICEEAKTAGINFEPDSQRVILPKSLSEVTVGENSYSKGTMCKFDTLMDGTDKKHNVSYEYVSETDLQAWISVKDAPYVYVNNIAKAYKEALGKAKLKGHNKVFSVSKPVPGDYYEYYYVDAKGEFDKAATEARQQMIEKATKEEVLADLRSQVKDFIQWLKAQGVI